ncbi:hypothetical protein FRC10_001991 [Ceratobasidium sp. 414]|nr:hypothetical protein FRC10_001991 [Ceratobasidium sp. 414]
MSNVTRARSNRALAGLFFVVSRAVHASPLFAKAIEEEPQETISGTRFWWKMVVSMGLVLLGGAFAGLTLGLMGLDELHLRVLAASSDDPNEKMNAQKVLRLMKKGRHWVLVVLLLGNVIVNESLPIFLDSAIGGGIAAVAISTVMIRVRLIGSVSVMPCAFNATPHRIIPQAVCARYGLQIGAASAPLVLSFMYIFGEHPSFSLARSSTHWYMRCPWPLLAPIAWPIAKLLDWALGKNEENTYKKAELKSFLQFHREGQEPLRDDEISILNGVLSLNEKKVSQIMTPIEDVVTLSSDTILDHQRVDAILSSGYSRFPIHEPGKPTSFIGLLLIKKLLVYDPSQQLPVSAFQLSILPEAKPSISCFQTAADFIGNLRYARTLNPGFRLLTVLDTSRILLQYSQTGRSHLLLISTDPGQPHGALGVITLEDIIEEIISEEIVDETDRYEDNRHKQRAKRQSTAAIMRGIVEREKRRWSFGSDAAPSAETPQTGSGALTPKPTPGKEPMEISRLVPIEEHPANGQYNGPSSYGSINRPSGSRMNGTPETERGRQLNGSTHAGSYTSSPTRI